MAVFAIEDELHSERVGEHPTLDEAVRELKRLARIPWDAEPNRAPCQNWRNCGRRYEVVEYDETRASVEGAAADGHARGNLVQRNLGARVH